MDTSSKFFYLLAIMAFVCLGTTGLSGWILFQTALDEERNRLTETAISQARLIEAVARFNKLFSRSYPQGPTAATISQIIDAHSNYAGFGKTGEFTLARRVGNNIVFILSHRHSDLGNPQPVPFDSELAQPMRLALLGESGTIIGPDYRGEPVLAAYEPVHILNLGIVAKIDMSEVLAPFIRGGLISVAVMLVLVFAGSMLFLKTSSPIIRRLKDHNQELNDINQQLMTEIEQRKKIQQSLGEMTNRLVSAQKMARMGDFTWDTGSGEVTWSDALYDLLGYDKSEKIDYQKVNAEIHHPDDLERVNRWLTDCVESGKGVLRPNEYRLIRTDGATIIARVSGVILDEPGASPKVFATIQDISELRLAELEREKLEAKLRQAHKMEAIGTLAGGIAHDFNNILAAILGYSDLALDEVPADSEVAQSIKAVISSAQRARDLTHQILSFSRQTKNQKKPLDLGQTIQEILKMLRATLPATIEIEHDIGMGLGEIMADPSQIHQILMNLCSNAAQAMEESGGVLRVALDLVDINEHSANNYINITPGKYQRLSISDTGVGMEKQLLDRIFDPFFTTKGVGKGTGMGLSVVHGIVTEYGGTITVYSEPGKGSEFHIYLPLVNISPMNIPPDEPRLLPIGHEKIIFVDDEEPLVDISRTALTNLGYQVNAFTSPLDALEFIRSAPDECDLLITDYTMPKMNGVQLVREALTIKPNLPVIMCTGFSERLQSSTVQELGVSRLVLKPLMPAEISRLVREIMDED